MNLPESNTWEPVRQWETTDPALGGPSSLFTQPIQNLTNRTKYLKGLLDAADIWKTATTAWMAAINTWQITINTWKTNTEHWITTYAEWKTTIDNWKAATSIQLANTTTWQTAVTAWQTTINTWKTTIDTWKATTTTTLANLYTWQASVGGILEDIQETWRPDVDYFMSTINAWKATIDSWKISASAAITNLEVWKTATDTWKAGIDTWKTGINSWQTMTNTAINNLTATQGKRLASGTYTMTETADHVEVTVTFPTALPDANYMVYLSAGTTLSNSTYIIGTTFVLWKGATNFKFAIHSIAPYAPCNGRYVDWVIFAK